MRLIDADAMKERLGMARDGLQCDDCDDPRACRYDSIYTKRDFCLCIDDEPTVEERKTGKWVLDEERSKECVEHIYICSACHNNEAWGEAERTRYCSQCGSRMLETKED